MAQSPEGDGQFDTAAQAVLQVPPELLLELLELLVPAVPLLDVLVLLSVPVLDVLLSVPVLDVPVPPVPPAPLLEVLELLGVPVLDVLDVDAGEPPAPPEPPLPVKSTSPPRMLRHPEALSTPTTIGALRVQLIRIPLADQRSQAPPAAPGTRSATSPSAT